MSHARNEGPGGCVPRNDYEGLRRDAERLATALRMARGFLGMAIDSPRSAAGVADEALAMHDARARDHGETVTERAWPVTIEICTKCGTRAEQSDRYQDGPFPIDPDACPQTPTCGSHTGERGLSGFKRCPGTRQVRVAEGVVSVSQLDALAGEWLAAYALLEGVANQLAADAERNDSGTDRRAVAALRRIAEVLRTADVKQ